MAQRRRNTGALFIVHVAQRFERLRDETEKDVTIAALDNKEDRKGHPAKLVTTDALPDDIEILPAPERLQGCTVASDSEGLAQTNFLKALMGQKKKSSL